VKAWVLRFQASVAELTPQQVALLLSVGLVLGVFPIMGCPTALCLLAAFVLRLNPVALQLVNNISSPLQIALLLPLARIGQRLCGAAAAGDGSWTGAIGWAALHAVAGWALVCPLLGAVLYFTLLLAIRKGASLQAAG
jgi:uncharacterized protein (DUF2062 family)